MSKAKAVFPWVNQRNCFSIEPCLSIRNPPALLTSQGPVWEGSRISLPSAAECEGLSGLGQWLPRAQLLTLATIWHHFDPGHLNRPEASPRLRKDAEGGRSELWLLGCALWFPNHLKSILSSDIYSSFSFREGIIVHFKSSGWKWNHSQRNLLLQGPTGDSKAWMQFPLCLVPLICPRGTGCCSLTSEQALCFDGGRSILPAFLHSPRPNNFSLEEQHRACGWLGQGSS